jgi:putative endonuclease
MSYCVYILYSESTNRYYKGQTTDLKDRLYRHNSGMEKATRFGRPWRLVWSCRKDSRSEAVILEKKLKNLSRKKLEEFISKYSSDSAGPDAPTVSVGGQDAD